MPAAPSPRPGTAAGGHPLGRSRRGLESSVVTETVVVAGLRHRYGDVVALDDMSWTAEAGRITAVLGPNGAGKTTMIEMAEGLRCPDAGTVRVLGRDPWRADAEHRALSRAGAVGEISGAFFDADGAAVHAGIADRVISVGTDQLRAIPDVIGIALGPTRTEVVRAAASTGLVDSLVCDVELADALLDGAGEPTG